MFDNIDYDHPKAYKRINHAIVHIRHQREIDRLKFMHGRMLGLLAAVMCNPTTAGNAGNLFKVEEKLYVAILDLLMGKESKQSPAKIAKKWKAEWNKVFGDQDDPAVQARINAATAAILNQGTRNARIPAK